MRLGNYGKILKKKENIDKKREEEIEAGKNGKKDKIIFTYVPARFKIATFDNFICFNEK